jgi:hypothetical protein
MEPKKQDASEAENRLNWGQVNSNLREKMVNLCVGVQHYPGVNSCRLNMWQK